MCHFSLQTRSPGRSTGQWPRRRDSRKVLALHCKCNMLHSIFSQQVSYDVKAITSANKFLVRVRIFWCPLFSYTSNFPRCIYYASPILVSAIVGSELSTTPRKFRLGQILFEFSDCCMHREYHVGVCWEGDSLELVQVDTIVNLVDVNVPLRVWRSALFASL